MCVCVCMCMCVYVPSLCLPLFPHSKRTLPALEDEDEGEISGMVAYGIPSDFNYLVKLKDYYI